MVKRTHSSPLGPQPSALSPGNFRSRGGGDFVLIFLCLAALLYPTLGLPLSRGEAMYAQIPLEMLTSGSLLTPTLNGVPYLEKPPLFYWLNLAALKICGPADWAARLPTLLLSLAEVWLTLKLGRLLLNPAAAWWGGFVLLSGIGFFYLHTQLFTDHLVTVTLMAALYALVRWLREGRFWWVALFHGAMAAGYLSKGLIGVGFPAVTALLYSWLGRERRCRRLVFHPGGLALLGLTLLPWPAVMTCEHPGFLWHHLVIEHLIRLGGARQPGGVSMISAPLFWLFLLIWLLPWTFLLPEAGYRFLRENAKNPGDPKLLLLLWPAVILAVFSLAGTRIEYYSLPALPALALILGWRLQCGLEKPPFLALTVALLALGLMSLLTAELPPLLGKLCAGNRREFVGLFAELPFLASQVGLLVPPLALLGAILARRAAGWGLMIYAAIAIGLLYFTCQALILLAPLRSDKIFGEWVRRQAGPHDLLVMETVEEFELAASLAFYARRPVLIVQRQGLPRLLYPVGPEKNYLISAEKLKALWAGPKRVFLLVDEAAPLADFLERGRVVLASGGKRLLVNMER